MALVIIAFVMALAMMIAATQILYMERRGEDFRSLRANRRRGHFVNSDRS